MPHYSGNKKQNGAALITALVLLIFITLLASVSLKTATLGEQTTRNYQEKVTTFQASESAVDHTIDNLSILKKALLNPGSGVTEEIALNSPNVTSQVTFTYLGTAPITGWTLDATGNGASRYQIKAEGRIPATGARTTTEHGYIRINPPSGG